MLLESSSNVIFVVPPFVCVSSPHLSAAAAFVAVPLDPACPSPFSAHAPDVTALSVPAAPAMVM